MEDSHEKQPANEPQKTAVAPQKTAVAPQKTSVAPQKTSVAPQKTSVAPQKTAVAPQKTSVAPQKTSVAPQKTSVAPQNIAAAGDASITGTAPHSATVAEGENITVGGKTYKVEKLLGSGTEGDIYIVSDSARQYALKRSHAGFSTNTKVMPALQKLKGKGYIADIYDYGDDFELLEFIPNGSAASADIKGNPEAILAIALKTAMALDQMHKQNVLHKDVKPANILIRDTTSWDSVLCDFGIADILNDRGTCVTEQVRTPIYAAPEVYGRNNTIVKENMTYCELTGKADFYSLGMTILSLWMGEGAFLAQEAEMAIDKTKGRITVPADMPATLARICRGLLIKKPESRWALDEIERTLDGEDVIVDEEGIIEDLNIVFNSSRQLVANTPLELANCMADDRELGTRYLYSGKIEKWLKPYPELAIQMQEIVEKRYPQNQEMGYYASLFMLNPAIPFVLSGISRETGEEVNTEAVTLKDVSNFCNDAIPNDDTIDDLASDLFKEWARVRNESVAENFPDSDGEAIDDTYLLRIQMIDPLTDINLRNDTSHPDYAMTGESIGRLLNQVYNIFWNKCNADIRNLRSLWKRPENAPLNRQISFEVVLNVAASFIDPRKYYYVSSFMNTKGNRFKDQTRWFFDATDYESEDNQKKAGPKDPDFHAQAGWMRVIKGFGATPEYLFADSGKSVTTLKDVFKENKKVLKNEYENRGLRGFLAVCHMEDPTADFKAGFAYEKALCDYIDDLARIDDKMEPVERFREAKAEAEKLLSEGKSKIRGLSIRNMAQYILTGIFVLLPALLLAVMLLFAIIENPLVDTSSLGIANFLWIVGAVIALILFFAAPDVGCLGSLGAGVVVALLLYLLVTFLGQFILYVYAVLVIGVLIYFVPNTILLRCEYADHATKFTKPGFDEKVLEPLYYAFNDDEEFRSSLSGAFEEEELDGWKEFLHLRGKLMFIFAAAVWFLLLFSFFIPKSKRFERLSAPVVNMVSPVFDKIGTTFDNLFPPAEEEEDEGPTLGFESLQPGTKGDQVIVLQQFLKDTGYLRSRADGDYGRRTERAVSAFQKDAGLPGTGIADTETVKAMNKKLKEIKQNNEVQ